MVKFRSIFVLFHISVIVLFGVACQDDEAGVPPPPEEGFVGNWVLEDLDAAFEVDGEDLLVYVAQVAESLGLPAQEVAVAVVLLESRAIQEMLEREPNMVLSSDQTFEYYQNDDLPLEGSWQLSADEQQLLLTSQAESLLTFLVISINETEMKLELDEEIQTELDILNLPAQIRAKLTMTWQRENADDP